MATLYCLRSNAISADLLGLLRCAEASPAVPKIMTMSMRNNYFNI